MFGRAGMLKVLLGVIPFLLALEMSSSPSHSGWFTKLVNKASDAGDGRKGIRGAGLADLGAAGLLVRNLPKGNRGHAVAASVSDDGHWHLMNGAGERVTVSGTDELEDAMKWLVPDRFNKERRLITFYMQDEGLLRNPEFIKILPAVARRVIVAGGKSYPVFFKRINSEEILHARLRDGIDVRLGDLEAFREVAWQMEKPLNKGNLRLLSLRQDAAKEIPKVGVVGSGGLPQPDEVDPYFLKSSFTSLRGQTVLITGRVKDDLLYFQPSGASDLSIFIKDIAEAARASDINLIILNTGRSRQPGGLDWLWRKVGIKGLEDGLQQKNFGDFLNMIGKGRGGFDVGVDLQRSSRASMLAGPRVLTPGILEHDNGPDYDGLGSALTDAVAVIKGDMLVASVMADLPSSSRQKELDDRIIPGIPSDLQHFYLGSLILGLIGFPASRRWWRRLWPQENHDQYGTRAALGGAIAVRAILFVLVFVPVVGIPAFFVSVDGWFRAIIMAPYNWFARRKHSG